jgi:3-dehydroquinate dehydratase-2
MRSVWVLNGPNLSRLGTREPEIYGTETLDDIEASLRKAFPGVELDFRQTNDEAELIGWIHDAVDQAVDVVLNPAAFTHYSYALRDACALLGQKGLALIEVHLSNTHAREEFRHTSVVSAVATGVIQGFGAESYHLALTYLTREH